MILSSYRTAIGERTGLDVSTTAANRDINFALQEIAAEYPWPWLEGSSTINVVANTASYALPTDLAQIRVVVEVGGNALDPLALEDADNYPYNDSLSMVFGQGTYYATNGNNIIIVPTPVAATTLTVRYQKVETTLVADGDSPLLPSSLDQLVVDLASYTVCNRHPGMEKIAAPMLANYNRLLRKAKHTYARRRGGPITPRIRPGAAW